MYLLYFEESSFARTTPRHNKGDRAAMKKIAIVSLVAFGAAFISSAALAEPPHIRTGGTKTKWGQSTCLKSVEVAVRAVGFNENLDVDDDDVEASKGNYSTETMCRKKTREIVVIVAGPDHKEVEKFHDDILSQISAQTNAKPPHIRTGSRKTKWGQSTCLKNVETAVRVVGFNENLDVGSNSLEASKGNYSTETICKKSQEIVVIVAGPDHKEAGKLRADISAQIRRIR